MISCKAIGKLIHFCILLIVLNKQYTKKGKNEDYMQMEQLATSVAIMLSIGNHNNKKATHLEWLSFLHLTCALYHDFAVHGMNSFKNYALFSLFTK